MNAVALRFYVHQPRKHGKRLLYEWLLEQGKSLGIHGGSAFFATAGYGRHGVIHEQRFFELPDVLPVLVEFIIRPEEAEHAGGVYRVEEKAFNRTGEADLCVSLTRRGAITLSLVALDADEVVGHILFSPVIILAEGADAGFSAVGMGPVAVLPLRQGQGIGSRLIHAGLEELRQQGHAAVVVLGDPNYYMRFGFEPAARHGIRFQDPAVPAEDFMVLELRRGVLQGHTGVAWYEPEFKDV
jgi:putative acetyltransferase